MKAKMKHFNKNMLICLYLIFFVSTTVAQDKKHYNWLTPPPKVQLDMEALDDIKGLGRLFLPAMTDPELEPVYTVSKDDSIIAEQKMGQSVWLRPGRYTIRYGSGTLDQLMRTVIEIQAEETKIVEPDWSGLTIRVIDETREWLKEPYELYRMPDGEAFGIGYGVDEQLGEKLQTWILKPGLYKIVKLGEHVNTYINFATVRLLPGELTRYTIVMDSDTKNFLGSGILELGTEIRKIKNWSLFGAFYGSFTLNRANDVTSEEQQTSMAFVAQLDYNVRYSTKRHYFLARGLIEEGWNLQRKQSLFRSYLDNVRLKNLYIFYFIPGIGLYGRFFVDTNLFKTTYFYDKLTTVYLYDEVGQLEERRWLVDRIVVSPNFSPLELKEGIGINISLIKSLRANFNIRGGMGFRQNINWKLYTKDAASDTIFNKNSSTYLRGPEASIVGNIRILRNIMVTSELDVLIPSEDYERLVYDWENNLNLRLSKNVSIDYTLRLKRDESIVPYVQKEQILLLRYSYTLF